MIPIIYTTIALFLYSALNVVLETKLSAPKPYHVTFALYLTGTCLFAPRVIYDLSVDYVQVTETCQPLLGWIIITCLGWLLADYLYVSAYTLKGNVYILTPIAGLIPVISSVIKAIGTDTRPTWQQALACVLAAAAVALVALPTAKTTPE